MSELIVPKNSMEFHRRLLTTVSALAILGLMQGSSRAETSDDDRPVVWIELGGQLSRLDDGQETFSPVLMVARPSVFTPSQKFENPPPSSIDEDGKILFQPDSSEWVFSASVRYGRSASDKHVHQQTSEKPFVQVFGTIFPPSAGKFADTLVRNSEQYVVLDFQAGRDVGLGMFGQKNGSSIFNFGIRFAQFSSRSNITLKSDPDFHRAYYYNGPYKISEGGIYHSNAAAIQAERSFHGIGPSISWDADAPLVGNLQNSELTFDWGVNAAILFGRQRAAVAHQTTAQYHPFEYGEFLPRHRITISHFSTTHPRNHTVTVPNVGGFAGISFRYPNAKISLGYRADFFFGAMDGGIDTAKRENVGFYGPFASVSVGLGG